MMPRKCKRQGCNPYAVFRSRWDTAQVAQFYRLYQRLDQNKCNFACLTFEGLEGALVDDKSVLLLNVRAKILCALTHCTDLPFAPAVLVSREKYIERYMYCPSRSVDKEFPVSKLSTTLPFPLREDSYF